MTRNEQIIKVKCCFIPNKDKPNEGCQNLATFQIWASDNPTLDDYTESCDKHIFELLDDNIRFELHRILEVIQEK